MLLELILGKLCSEYSILKGFFFFFGWWSNVVTKSSVALVVFSKEPLETIPTPRCRLEVRGRVGIFRGSLEDASLGAVFLEIPPREPFSEEAMENTIGIMPIKKVYIYDALRTS